MRRLWVVEGLLWGIAAALVSVLMAFVISAYQYMPFAGGSTSRALLIVAGPFLGALVIRLAVEIWWWRGEGE